MRFPFWHIIIAVAISIPASNQAQTSKTPRYIDSIQNSQQIVNLIYQTDKKLKGLFKIENQIRYSSEVCQLIADSLKVKPWTKSDLDGNGTTDLLIAGYMNSLAVICILDHGHKGYEIKYIIPRGSQYCSFPLAIRDNVTSGIAYYYKSYLAQEKLKADTLIYKYGGFIEQNSGASHQIEKIEYSSTFCYGTYPVFDIEIYADKTASFHAKKYNVIRKKEIKGRFQTIVDPERFNEIINLVNYINPEKMEKRYAVRWTDASTSNLTIYYDGGKKKTISDYGGMGTFGLERLYDLISDLRENQNWKK